MGENRKAQNPGEMIAAVIAAMCPPGTPSAASICGRVTTAKPFIMPNVELVSPNTQTGGCGRAAARRSVTAACRADQAPAWARASRADYA